MSRIHEAMQRAAEQSGQPASAVTMESPFTTEDMADVSHEMFPIEMAERRKPRAATPAAAPASASVQPAQAAGPAAATRRGTPERRSLDAATELPMSFERIDARYAGKIVVDAEVSGTSREQYRRLAASLHHAQAATGIKVVMITSAVMGEGKTLTASNLALTLSESYQKQVLLIDADLRRPALHNVFKVRGASGLSEGLVESHDRKIPVQQISNRLGILTAGEPTSDPIAGLTSPRMRRLLEEAREAFDWIVLDTPPVAMLPDANLLTSMVDGAVVVVRAGSTPWDLVQRAVAAIGRERTLGVVLNSASELEGGSGHYAYDYSSTQGEAEPST